MLNAIVVAIRFVLLILGSQKLVALEMPPCASNWQYSKVTLAIITGRERTWLWTRMRRIHDHCSTVRWGKSFKFEKWADCIIGTNAWLLDIGSRS